MIIPLAGPGGTTPDQQAEFSFRGMDRNQDGVLSFEEMSARLQNEYDRWDTNKDGFIDPQRVQGLLRRPLGGARGPQQPARP